MYSMYFVSGVEVSPSRRPLPYDIVQHHVRSLKIDRLKGNRHKHCVSKERDKHTGSHKFDWTVAETKLEYKNFNMVVLYSNITINVYFVYVGRPIGFFGTLECYNTKS